MHQHTVIYIICIMKTKYLWILLVYKRNYKRNLGHYVVLLKNKNSQMLSQHQFVLAQHDLLSITLNILLLLYIYRVQMQKKCFEVIYSGIKHVTIMLINLIWI